MKKEHLLWIACFAIGVMISSLFWMIGTQRPNENISKKDTADTPQRIICAAPSIVEVVFALDQGDKVVGVSDFTTYPPEAARIEEIGGIINPNLERIVTLKPDLIIVLGEMEAVTTLCKQKNIPYLRVDMANLESVFNDIIKIGDVLNCQEKAVKLMQNINDQLGKINKLSQEKEVTPNVFLCIGRRGGSLTGLYTINNDTFLNDLLEIAGGRNIYEDIEGAYPQVSKESLLKRVPDVIIELFPNNASMSGSIEQNLSDWQAMPNLPAVANGRVYSVTNDYIMIPGPRMGLTAQRFYELIHAKRP